MKDSSSNSRNRIIICCLIVSITSLTVVFSCSTTGLNGVCKEGWFGSSCQYKCRCESYQCTVNGTCQPGYKCQGGWFGPECQYMDIAFNKSNPALDGNDTTCTTSKTGVITVILNKTFPSFHITWMRVHINIPWTEQFVQNLNINFKGKETYNCINARNSTVDKQTLDVHCDLPDTVHSVTLQGPAVSYLCSVYVSGGRNLALGQATSQSSNYSQTSLSSCAVDGDTNGDFINRKTCTHTAEGNKDTNPIWRLNLTTPGQVTRFLIYNRNGHQHRLRGFLLESLDSKKKKVFAYQDKSSQDNLVFKIVLSNLTSPVSSLEIRLPPSNNAMLTLCEVEIYGESSCPRGWYGRECQYRCNCKGDTDCFVSTGGCPAGCAEGYLGDICKQACDTGTYGPGCQYNCSSYCGDSKNTSVSVCDHVTGTCLYGCQVGYQGSNCSSPCMTGTYGQGCQHTCSPFCGDSINTSVSVCDHLTGRCFFGCQAGYQGHNCSSPCITGTHGLDCQHNCSSFCGDSRNSSVSACDHVTGTCLFGCQTGYQGYNCSRICDMGTYGPGCQHNCSSLCGDSKDISVSVCDHVTGRCLFGCQEGYQGSNCSSPCDAGTYGPECQHNCSSFCGDSSFTSISVCDHVTGRCLFGCQTGYSFSTCSSPCSKDTFGPSCRFTCSPFCARKTQTTSSCHHVDGHCLFGCHDGYRGLKCKTPWKETIIIITVSVICAVSVVALIASNIRFCIYRQNRKNEDNGIKDITIRKLEDVYQDTKTTCMTAHSVGVEISIQMASKIINEHLYNACSHEDIDTENHYYAIEDVRR